MIGKVLKGRSFRGLLDYLAGKPGARLLGGNMEGTTPRELARELAAVRALRPTVRRPVRHIPLRLPYDERLTDAQWRRIADRVLAGLGYVNSPYSLYLHPQDPGGEHLHIVASGIDLFGQVVDDSFDIRRLMAIERRIERDYGLRQVPSVRNDLRRPLRAEYKVTEATGRPSERQDLQRLLDAAARPGRTLTEFLADLDRQGVAVSPRILTSGQINGITYRRGDYEFSGSGLGAAFTWPGLQSRRHLDFDPARDLPALFAAAAAERFKRAATAPPPTDLPAPPPAEPAAPAPPALPLPAHAPAALFAEDLPMPDTPTTAEDSTPAATSTGAAATGATASPAAGATASPAAAFTGATASPVAAATGAAASPAAAAAIASTNPPAATAAAPPSQLDRTADQVAGQLAALGCPRFDILVLDASTGAHRHLRSAWTPEQVLGALGWLRHQNAQGGEILVRPAAPAGLSFFEGVTGPRLDAAIADGFEPAAVVRAPDATREVWMRGTAEVPPRVQQLIDDELARALAATRPVRTPGYGHLAGFTSPMAQRAAGVARPPFLTLDRARGRVYRRHAALARDCRERASREDLERRTARDLEALGRTLPPTAANGHPRSDTAQRPTPQAAALLQLRDEADREAHRLGLASPYTRDPAVVEASLARWSAARAAHQEALAATAAAAPTAGTAGAAPHGAPRTPAPETEAAVVETFRRLERERQGLAEQLGVRDIAADLPPAAARDLARWRSVLAAAEATLDHLLTDADTPPNERLEAAVTVRTLREELTDAIRQHGLLPAEEPATAMHPDSQPLLDPLPALVAPVDPAPQPGVEASLHPRSASPAQAEAPPPPQPAPEVPDAFLFAAYEAAATRLATAQEHAAAPPDPPAPSVDAPHGIPSSPAADTAWSLRLAAELALDERETAVRSQLQAVTRAYERSSLDLDALEPRLMTEPTPQRAVAYDALISRLVALEDSQIALEQRRLQLADHRLARDLARTEQSLATAPTDRLLDRYARLHDERREVAPRAPHVPLASHAASAPHPTSAPSDAHPGEAATPPRATAEIPPPHTVSPAQLQDAADSLRAARSNLLLHPSPEAVHTYAAALGQQRDLAARASALAASQEIRTARKEARIAADRFLDAAASASAGSPDATGVHLARWRRALNHHQAAEARLAARLDAVEPPERPLARQLAHLRGRILRGDLSPDTLSRLQRILTHAARPQTGRAIPPPPSGLRMDLAGAIGAYRVSRDELRHAARNLPANPAPADLVSLRRAVTRAQAAAADLDRLSFAPALGQAPTRGTAAALPPRYFLDHPAFAGQAHRATASWSAHASERGVEPTRIAQALPRSRQSRTASPRALSSHYGLFLASVVARLGQTLWHHYAQEP
jgi:hypothetical protein